MNILNFRYVRECWVTQCSNYDELKPNNHYCQLGFDDPAGCKIFHFAQGHNGYSGRPLFKPFSDEEIAFCKSQLTGGADGRAI